MFQLLLAVLILISSTASLDYFKDIEKCSFTEKGEEYIGITSTTKSGKKCKAWDKVLESRTDLKATHISDKSTATAQNYCRNPNSNPTGTWCYYGDLANQWEICDIPKCDEVENCKDTKMGVEYDGDINVTKIGQTCQRWDQQKPHAHRFTESSFPENDLKRTGNKCRNPDKELVPWCYTTDDKKRWEYCDVPFCKKEPSQSEYFRGQDIGTSIKKGVFEFDMQTLISSVAILMTVPKKFWTDDIQRKTSIRSTKYSSKCQRDLNYYEYCAADQITNIGDDTQITFNCKTPLLSVMIITPLERTQFSQILTKGPQHVVNNVLGSDLIQYMDKRNIRYDVSSVNISIVGNGSPFNILRGNVIPYAVTKDDDIAMTISKHGLGSIGFMCGEYFTRQQYQSQLNDYYSRVYGESNVKPEYISKSYIQKLSEIWMNKNEIKGSVIWNAHDSIGKENVKLLITMVQKGLNIIVGIKSWAYYYYNSKFEDSELKDLFLAAGLWPNRKSIYGELRIINKLEVKLFPLVHLLEYAKANITSALTVSESIKSTISNVPSKVFIELEIMGELKTKVFELYQSYVDVIPSLVPCLENPSVDKDNRLLLDMFNAILLNSFGNVFTAPGINFYPGTLNKKSNTFENVNLKLNLQMYNENYFLGVFVPVSTVVVVQLKAKKSKKCTLNVNFHLFDVSNWDRWDKWPRTGSNYVFESGETDTFIDSFGGLLSISCDTNDDSVELRLKNVLQVAMYDRRNRPLDSSWNNLRKGPVPWAILAGDTFVMLVPSIATRNMENPVPIIELWDKMIKEQFYLRGRSVAGSHREIISTDFQIKAGYMHAGYPIGTFIQHVANPMLRDKFLFAHDKLLREGYWGVNHEVGHNLQNKLFTFTGTTDVTNNVFTLVAVEMISGRSSWNETEGWVSEGEIPAMITHINTRKFSNWQSKPFVGLGTYAQLRAAFGWEFFRQIFRRYDELILTNDKNVNSIDENGKIQLWIVESSVLVKMNLLPLYDYWAWPITDETKQALQKYPAFFPDDFLTKKTPEKVNDIVRKYGGDKVVSRTPLPIPIIFGPLKQDVKVEGRKVIEEMTIF